MVDKAFFNERRRGLPRPGEILWFEKLYLACIAICAAEMATRVATSEAGISNEMLPALLLMTSVGFGISLTLTFLTSRGSSRIAMWILVAFFIVGLPSDAVTLFKGDSVALAVITLLRALVEAAALGFLFTPSARRWFKRMPDDQILQETFS